MAETDTGARWAKIKPVIQVGSGNFLEMYDFFVFAYYATEIGKAYFPTSSAFASLMLALATFGVGYLMRPLGAIVLGGYIDHHGRRAGLLLTLSLMSLGTLSVALTPGYASIGLLAPAIVVAGRLLQGFSAGAELGGVSVYLAEIATPGHKGFYVSWQSASQQIAVAFAAIVGLVLLKAMTPDAMEAWGWRIPLLIGCAIVPFLFLLRRSLAETEEFQNRSEAPPSLAAIWRSLVINWRVVMIGVALVIMTTVSFYLITAYTPTFGRQVLHLDKAAIQVVLLCIGLSNLFWLPVMGAVSDRLGRKPLLLAFTVLALLTAYPVMAWLVQAPSFERLLLAELWLSFLYGSYNGAMVVHLTEIMPAHVRGCGFSLAYSLATTLGGFTPAICTWLIEATGNKAMPGAWMAIAALIGLSAVVLGARATVRSRPAPGMAPAL
jgi:MFS family permease